MEFTGEQDFIPFRYQGQYEDIEIGLYYNRFRYYSPIEGMYTQLDPLGLEGGNPTIYGYVSDPNIWIDPFGLITWNTARKNFWKEEALKNPFVQGSNGKIYKYSPANLARMAKGKAPQILVEIVG
ncbi:RHS repeat-associated core domain-containing protein [Bacillus sp. RS11]|uniref:RHS repeat-associated core domain-containing protein n=1 Tax=Lysinibacillus sp. RS11 TaxID=3242682 RepID=UPI0035C6A4AE